MWIAIKKDTFLSAEDLNNIYTDFLEIASKMTELEYEPPEIENCAASYDTLPDEILGYINAVERNIQSIHKVIAGTIIGWTDKHYKKFLWKPVTKNKKAEVFRWIDWLNDVYKALSNTTLTWEPLTDINGETVTDSNGEIIYTAERRLK